MIIKLSEGKILNFYKLFFFPNFNTFNFNKTIELTFYTDKKIKIKTSARRCTYPEIQTRTEPEIR